MGPARACPSPASQAPEARWAAGSSASSASSTDIAVLYQYGHAASCTSMDTQHPAPVQAPSCQA
eukprot:13439134-Alexandrium_andersonii.AAC.1